jgi:hypothetical protein
MSAKIQGGSVFPNPRLSPSGPLLSGEGGPIVQLGFDQTVFSEGLGGYVFPDFAVPTEADIIASKIPRDVDDPLGPPLSVTLRSVKKGNLIAAWFSFGTICESPGNSTFVLGFDDGAGGDAGLIAFAIQTVVFALAGEDEQGSILTLIPNPYGEQRDVRIFPSAFSLVPNVGQIFPAAYQNALMAAEIAKT